MRFRFPSPAPNHDSGSLLNQRRRANFRPRENDFALALKGSFPIATLDYIIRAPAKMNNDLSILVL